MSETFRTQGRLMSTAALPDSPLQEYCCTWLQMLHCCHNAFSRCECMQLFQQFRLASMAELVEELVEQLEGRPAPRLQREAALQRRRSSRVTRPRLPPGAPLLSNSSCCLAAHSLRWL